MLQRSSRAHVGALDRQLAALAGNAAVDLAASATPKAPVMVSLRQRSDGWEAEPVPLEPVGGERTVPPSMQDDPGELRPFLM